MDCCRQVSCSDTIFVMTDNEGNCTARIRYVESVVYNCLEIISGTCEYRKTNDFDSFTAP
jgi:hypothetical protein